MRLSRLISLGLLVLLSLTMLPGAVTAQGNSENAQLCQKGGWETLQGANGTLFANQDECVSYAAEGGTLIPKTRPSITAWATYQPTLVYGRPGFVVHVSGTGFAPNLTVRLQIMSELGGISGVTTVTDGDGVLTYSSTDQPYPYVFECRGWNSVATKAEVMVYTWNSTSGTTILATTTTPVSCVLE